MKTFVLPALALAGAFVLSGFYLTPEATGRTVDSSTGTEIKGGVCFIYTTPFLACTANDSHWTCIFCCSCQNDQTRVAQSLSGNKLQTVACPCSYSRGTYQQLTNDSCVGSGVAAQ